MIWRQVAEDYWVSRIGYLFTDIAERDEGGVEWQIAIEGRTPEEPVRSLADGHAEDVSAAQSKIAEVAAELITNMVEDLESRPETEDSAEITRRIRLIART